MFYASVPFKQFQLRPFHLHSDSFSIAKGIQFICLVQLVLWSQVWTLTDVCLQIQYSKIFVLRAQSVVIQLEQLLQLKAPIPLPFHIVVGKCSWLQDWKKSKQSPFIRTRHYCVVFIETSHCTKPQSLVYTKIHSYLNALCNSYI